VEQSDPSRVEIQDLFLTDRAGGITFASGTVTAAVGKGLKICFQKRYREISCISSQPDHAEIEHPYRNTQLPGRLFHPKYRSQFRLGAMTTAAGHGPLQISGPR
jgi:hypothetical protein